MKKFILACLFLCGSFAVPNEPARASGATVVFLKVRLQDYFMTSAVRDTVFNSTKLFNVLELSQRGVYVSRVNPFIYRTVSYYTALGYDVALGFENDPDVTFRYIASYRAIIGVTSNEDIVVLLPKGKGPTRPTLRLPYIEPLNEDNSIDGDEVDELDLFEAN